MGFLRCRGGSARKCANTPIVKWLRDHVSKHPWSRSIKSHEKSLRGAAVRRFARKPAGTVVEYPEVAVLLRAVVCVSSQNAKKKDTNLFSFHADNRAAHRVSPPWRMQLWELIVILVSTFLLLAGARTCVMLLHDRLEVSRATMHVATGDGP